MNNRSLLVLGDSHLEALKFAADLNLLEVHNHSFTIVPGATAVGLRNPNSLTDALNIFKHSLSNQSLDSYVLLHLGEVDCGFVIWWRAEKYGESIDIQLKESIEAYSNFLKEIIEKGFKKICVTGASLPTIKDGFNLGQVANKRSEILVSMKLRTQLTLKYNLDLEKIAKSLGLFYFDITDAVLDKSNMFVHDFFLKEDRTDHHLDSLKTVGVWADKCNNFIKQIDGECIG